MAKLRHVGIVVQDMDKMKDYYSQNGGEVVYDESEKVRIVKLKFPNAMIELLEFETMSENVLRKRGISHVAFTADPEDNWLEIVKEDKPPDYLAKD